MKRSDEDAVDWGSRAERLAKIAARAHLSDDFPLAKALRLDEAMFSRLEGAVATYLWHSLSGAFHQQTFNLSARILNDYAPYIMKLPNRTPNGVLLPRHETFLSFNLIHQALAGIFTALDLLPHFSALQCPCNVRIVSGAPDPAAEARPYASNKIHTDVWNAEPISAVLFNIPVLGDTDAVDLVFMEPREFPENLRRALDDYTLGERVIASARPYKMKFRMGAAYMSDALSLHQTIKRGPSLRLSLDFRAIARDLLPGETDSSGASKASYVAPDLWRAAGSSVVLGSGKPLDAFQRQQLGEPVTSTSLSLSTIEE
ncbi:MAG: hypothetical protein JWL84_5553 [Rhodospirillales bacterium]|jgi:hypothetical protein|nr:hypothetical protein [Rhodospirillales bacterium]